MTPKEKQILSVIAAVAILAGGYVWAAKYRTTSPQPSPLPGEGVADETAGWKIYTNTKHGLSFKYPENAKLTASDDGIGLDVPITDTASEVRVRLAGKTDVIFMVTNSQLPYTLTPDWVAQQYADPKRIHPTRITMLGLSGFKVPHDDYVVSDHYYLQKSDGYFLEIVVNGPIANQILSTFKFTK